MYDILFLSRIIPEEIDADVRSKMSRTMDDAAIAWQHHVIAGIEDINGMPVKLLNYLPVKSYPQNYREAFVKRREFSHVPGADDVNLPFCNIKYIKRLFQGKSLYREIKKWAAQDNGAPKVIISYTLYPEYLKAIEIAKKIAPDLTALAIVLDLPEYSVLTNRMSPYTRMYLAWSKREADKRIQCIDRFVLLTSPMAEALSIDKPYCVIEGICSENISMQSSGTDKIKRIFYAGTLHQRFGILHLLNAFRLIQDEHFRLVICGYGDSEDAVRMAAAEDPRIDFKGQLHRAEVLRLMEMANVIVNPRCNHEEFTKYSFPSKNLEALSSGIPFVGYKLAGIPDEYDTYINYPVSETAESLAAILEEAGNDLDGKYAMRALNARQWVLQCKNSKVQAKRILDLIERNSE